MVQIAGGSQGDIDTTNQNTNSIFKSGVNWHKLTIKKEEQVRLLPAFDYSLSWNDQAFKTSYVSYRNRSLKPDEETNTPGFTEWYFPIQAYNFWGKENKNFISPITGNKQPPRGLDPIYDLFVHCKNSSDPQLKMLTEKKDGPGYAQPILRYPQTLILCNALMMNEKTNKMENRIVVFTASGLSHLKNALKMKPGRSDKVVTPEWEEFMLGDVTDPQTGAVAKTRPIVVGANSNIKTSGLCYTNDIQTLDGYYQFPIDTNSVEGKTFLENRYNMMDVENTFVVPTYDELVTNLVVDGEVPYEVVDSICAQHMNSAMPDKPKNMVVSTPQAGAQQPQGFGQQPPQNQQPQGFGQQPSNQPVAQSQQQGFGQPNPQQEAVNSSLAGTQNQEQDDIPMGDTSQRFKELTEKISSGAATHEEIQEFAKLNS